MDKPLRRAMSNPQATSRMALWAIELSEFNIQYRPHTTMKRQVVVDFITEFTNMESQGAGKHPQWNIHTDESSNRQASRAGIVLHSLEGDEIECMIHLDFPTTNNEAEYKALVVGLDLTKVAGVTSVVVYYDSQVVTSQVNGDFECKGERMKKCLEQGNGWMTFKPSLFKSQGERTSKPTVLPRPHQRNTCSSSVRYFLLFSFHL